MPLVLPPLLIAMEAALLALAAYMLMRLATAWLRPLIASLGALFPGGSLVKKASAWYSSLPKFVKFALYPVVPIVGVPLAIAKAYRLIEHRVTQALGYVANAAMLPFAGFVNSLAHEISALAFEVADLAETTWGAFSHLTADTIPRLATDAIDTALERSGAITAAITDALAPVEVGIDRLRARVADLERVVAGINRAGALSYIDQSIDRLKTELLTDLSAVSAGIYAGIDQLRRNVFGALDSAVSDIWARIRGIEAALSPAAIAAAAVAAVVSFAPNLFCRNTNRTTTALCGMNEQALLDALAFAFTVAAIADLKTLVRVMQTVVEDTGRVMQALSDV